MSAKQKAVFLSLILIFIALPLFADVLVLKNGKKLLGEIINEDDKVYELRDSAGIVLTVKKSQVDLEATQKLNPIQTKSEVTSQASEETKSELKPENPSVADLARAARANRTGSAKVLRKEDLEQTPELSIIGTTQSEESIEDHNTPPPADHYSEKNEQYWKDQTRQFATDLHRAQDDVNFLTKECDDLNKQAAYAIVDPSQYIVVNGVLIPISGSGYDSTTIRRAEEVCYQSEQAKRELTRIEKELEAFQEDARKQGALPGWIDPDRL
jgi:hypothetical protein